MAGMSRAAHDRPTAGDWGNVHATGRDRPRLRGADSAPHRAPRRMGRATRSRQGNPMDAFLSTLLDLSVIVFAVTSMLSVGFGSTFRRILGPLRDPGKVTRAIVANFVLVPALAYLTVQLVPLEPARAIALFLVAAAAGAP